MKKIFIILATMFVYSCAPSPTFANDRQHLVNCHVGHQTFVASVYDCRRYQQQYRYSYQNRHNQYNNHYRYNRPYNRHYNHDLGSSILNYFLYKNHNKPHH